MSDVAAVEAAELVREDTQRSPWRVLFSTAWAQHRTKIGLGITLLLVGIALFGRLVAPYPPDQGLEGQLPFAPPSSEAWFGTDTLGRDVFSRFLAGGLSVLVLSGLSTALGMVFGVAVGLVAAYSRGKLDDVLMRTMDVLLSLPQIVFALVLAATVGPELWLLVLAVGLTTVPRAARVTRGAAVEVVERDFVRAAEAIGLPRRRILLSEVLPNISSPLIVETTLRMSFNVAVVAGLSFLGFGLQPPAADWGLMINENKNGLTLQPWPVLLPVIAIALLTIGTSLVGDGLARAAIGIERGRTGAQVSTGAPALEVVDLRVEIDYGDREDIVDGISFSVGAGDVLSLVGESGSGKTTIGLAVLGHTRRGARIAHGEVRIEGRDILTLPPLERQRLRGRLVSYVPQDPAASLNPALRIGTQLEETLSSHGFGSAEERRARIAETLGEVLLPSDDAFLHRYPHQLSGGQQQRVALAMAFANRPRVIVLDEPTTGLDVTTQAHVLETVRDLCAAHGVAAVYVSHDLAVVATLAGQVAVMYGGRLVELGPTGTLFRLSAHPYTRRLVEAIPELSGQHALVGIPGTAPRPGQRPEGCFFAPRCTYAVGRCRSEFPPVERVTDDHAVRCWERSSVLAESLAARPAAVPLPEVNAEQSLVAVNGVDASHGPRQVLFGVDVVVRPQECVALVGESGSGKTTLARCIAGLHTTYEGEISFRGQPLPPGARTRDREARREIQYVFQSPYSSLNPRKSIGQIIGQPLRLFFDLGGREARARTAEVLQTVQLSASVMERFPHHLSGGERQRVAIARALVANPQLLICDEVTSALDVSVQAAIVDLLANLQRELGLGLLFVTHNLALIRTIAQEVVVMSEGRIVERGLVEDVLDRPQADVHEEAPVGHPEPGGGDRRRGLGAAAAKKGVEMDSTDRPHADLEDAGTTDPARGDTSAQLLRRALL